MNNFFENQWKKAFEDAEEIPPIDIWRNIEGKLDEEAISEASLVHTLLSASETPDASVWANIEKELDKEKPVLVIWFQKYASTAIAAMVFLALSFSLLNNLFDRDSSKEKFQADVSLLESKALLGDSYNGSEDNSKETLNSKTLSSKAFSPTYYSKTLSNNLGSSKATLVLDSKSPSSSKTILETLINEEEKVSSVIHESISSLKLLIKKEFDNYGNRFTMKRKKLSFETPDNLLADNQASFVKRSWFGLFSGISPFDPNFKINNFERAALVSASDVPRSSFEFNSVGDTGGPLSKNETFTIPLSQPYNNVKSGRSINLSVNYGKRIKKHWSVESGVRYLAGNSLVASNVYSYNQYTGSVQSFLESNYIRQDAGVFDNTVISSGGDIDSDYKFLMIPVQVGYHLPMTSKLEASFTTGVSGDFIINNVFDNISEGGSKLTAGNSAYKPLNLSGLAGVKFNYSVRDDWQISLGSGLQQTLTSGVEKTESFSFKPRYLGINYGVSYRFK